MSATTCCSVTQGSQNNQTVLLSVKLPKIIPRRLDLRRPKSSSSVPRIYNIRQTERIKSLLNSSFAMSNDLMEQMCYHRCDVMLKVTPNFICFVSVVLCKE